MKLKLYTSFLLLNTVLKKLNTPSYEFPLSDCFFFNYFFLNRHRTSKEGNNIEFQLRHLIKILSLTEGYVPQLL